MVETDIQSGIQAVVARIVRRYANPGRKAYVYLFQVATEANFKLLIPAPESVVAAWMDEGEGLAPIAVPVAVEQSTAISTIPKPAHYNAALYTPTQRKQLMSRVVQFSVRYLADEQIEVHLVSRSPIYAPKGDREVIETWQHDPDMLWYSAYHTEEEPS